MTTPPVFHVAADIMNAEADEILDAFSGLPYRTRKKNSDELRVDGDDLSFDIYASGKSAATRQHFLVSGEIEGTEADVRRAMQSIADGLTARGLVFNFEVEQQDEPENSFIVRHPKFGA
jgi:hypothetical protein